MNCSHSSSSGRVATVFSGAHSSGPFVRSGSLGLKLALVIKTAFTRGAQQHVCRPSTLHVRMIFRHLMCIISTKLLACESLTPCQPCQKTYHQQARRDFINHLNLILYCMPHKKPKSVTFDTFKKIEALLEHHRKSLVLPRICTAQNTVKFSAPQTCPPARRVLPLTLHRTCRSR